LHLIVQGGIFSHLLKMLEKKRWYEDNNLFSYSNEFH